ncbi:hypothetical protein PTNB85_00710 [Pyrenophora teres f. teres]|nr:hypothetical protein PTNB85_00710 [Pyrenophora teres f. teres]KAE8851682.1 hypothetical protein HRS9122_01969 [Pyrenophora teres f. teres]
MAVLTDLPVELLVCVFHYLESIDDVHYLGRVCKKTYGIISQRSFYLEIIRTVIQYAPQHRYDYQLCNVLRLHHNVVNDLERHYRTSLGVVPGTVPLYDFTSSWQQSLKSITSSCSDLAAWSDNAVCDVLARYQGIRILEDVWLERELSETDFVTVDGSSDAQQLEDRYFDLCDRNDQFADGELPPRNPQNPHTQSYIKFNSDQRGRFYAALVYVWLLSEIQWVSTQLVQLGSVSMSGLVRSLENCKNSMAKEQASPLLDELDRYAVFTFLYHHLFPLYAEFLADQDSSQLPLTFDSDFNNHGAHWMLQLVLMAGQAYLQPPDLIDLLVREKPVSTLFPVGVSLCDESYQESFQIMSQYCLSVICRSSILSERQRAVLRPIGLPALGKGLFRVVADYTRMYLSERAMVAFEMHESRREDMRVVRTAFPREWKHMQWSIWWWANSEDKARMKMERWTLGAGRTL